MAKYRHPDLVNSTRITIGKVLNENREQLLFSENVDTLKTMLKTLFDDNKINTPKSREILYKLSIMTSHSTAIQYVQNIIFSAKNMNVFS